MLNEHLKNSSFNEALGHATALGLIIRLTINFAAAYMVIVGETTGHSLFAPFAMIVAAIVYISAVIPSVKYTKRRKILKALIVVPITMAVYYALKNEAMWLLFLILIVSYSIRIIEGYIDGRDTRNHKIQIGETTHSN